MTTMPPMLSACCEAIMVVGICTDCGNPTVAIARYDNGPEPEELDMVVARLVEVERAEHGDRFPGTDEELAATITCVLSHFAKDLCSATNMPKEVGQIMDSLVHKVATWLRDGEVST